MRYFIFGLVALLAACTCKAQEEPKKNISYVIPIEHAARLACDVAALYYKQAKDESTVSVLHEMSKWSKDANLKFEQNSYDLFKNAEMASIRSYFNYQECLIRVTIISQKQFFVPED